MEDISKNSVEKRFGNLVTIKDELYGIREQADFSFIYPDGHSEGFRVFYLPMYPPVDGLLGDFEFSNREHFVAHCEYGKLPIGEYGSERALSFARHDQLCASGFPKDYAPSPIRTSATTVFRAVLGYTRMHSASSETDSFYFTADNGRLEKLYNRFINGLAKGRYRDVNCIQFLIEGEGSGQYALQIGRTQTQSLSGTGS